MLVLQGISYTHPNKDALFTNLDLTVAKGEKVALVGNNGTGKSTLLNIMAGNLPVTAGVVKAKSRPYYVPQLTEAYNDITIAGALGISQKIVALKAILEGGATAQNFALLDDDWDIEERCVQAFEHWELKGVSLLQKMNALSGGQKTKVFLAGVDIHQPEIVLLDEPSNHLDNTGRAALYDFIKTSRATLVIVSHDRTLLNLADKVHELNQDGISTYGGNYNLYRLQKETELGALEAGLQAREKELRKAKAVERTAMERQQKLDARGRKKQEKAGMPTIMMHTMRNNAENSTAGTKAVHEKKVGGLQDEVRELRNAIPDNDKMKLHLDNSGLHRGKILFKVAELNFGFGKPLWPANLNFEITSGERLNIAGANGCGKTTLVKLLMGKLDPAEGKVDKTNARIVYIDQDYSVLDNRLTVYEHAQAHNATGLAEHEINIGLTRFLFARNMWDRPCGALSGGERMRLLLCCLSIAHKAPDVIILDEPTNNLDIQNVEILTTALNEYKGTLIVISHDETFVTEVGIERSIALLNVII